MCNGIFTGDEFYSHQNEYEEMLASSPLDGFMAEGLWYDYSSMKWYSEQQWLNAVNFLVYVQYNFLKANQSRFFVPTCELQTSDGIKQLPSDSTAEQMATYAYTSTLLGAATNQNYLGITSDTDFANQVVQPLYNVSVGAPINEYYMIAGTHVYGRDFTNVKVLVNPTSQSFTVNLGKNYEMLSGQIVSSFNVGPHTGVLLKGIRK